MKTSPSNITSATQGQAETNSIPVWIQEIRDGKTDIPEDILLDIFKRLVVFASRHLNHPQVTRIYDAEDAAQSALRSFCLGLRNQKFADVKDDDAVWKTLLTITKRKIIDRIQFETRQKRGSGKIFSESIFEEERCLGLDSMEGNELPPDLILDISDELNFKLEQLDEKLKVIALLRVEGYSNGEIARRHDCTERTIERKLALIRKTWQHTPR